MLKLLATSLKKAVKIESKAYPPNNYNNLYGVTNPKIPHFISRLSTRFLTAFFREVASSFNIN
jgi:hypothetical protein